MSRNLKWLLPFLLLPSMAMGELLKEEQYEKIKETFVSEARDRGADITLLTIRDYAKITEDEKNILEKRRSLYDDSPSEVIRFVVDNGSNLNNLALLEANDNKTTWVMPINMQPNGFLENKCSYIQMIGSNEDCLSLNSKLKENVKDFLMYHDIKINEEYMSDFYFIHELAHLLPSQKRFPNGTDITKIWVDDQLSHYSEIYSDLFAIIFLNNYLGYDVKSIVNVINFRNFNLTANNDLKHYSPPYIEELMKTKDWLKAKSFEDIDSFIQSVFLKVNKTKIISKKEYKMIHHNNFVWCNNIDISLFKSREELEMIIYHCKKMKKH